MMILTEPAKFQEHIIIKIPRAIFGKIKQVEEIQGDHDHMPSIEILTFCILT